MSLVAWLVVLFSIYTIGQLFAILRLGDRFEMDPDAGQFRPNIWNQPQTPTDASVDSKSKTQADLSQCPACGILNETVYEFCRSCAKPIPD
jgi:hypothetical protein